MILVTGLSGMVGKYLQENLEKESLAYTFLSRKEFDLENLESIDEALKNKKFTHFIHLAAETNVDLCEKDPQHAYICNFYATKKIAEYCEKMNARLIFISTSAVFGGIPSKIRYCELDTPFPSNYYGATKHFAEKVVQSICANHVIIRASWMIGGGKERDSKFVGKLIAQLQEGKKEVSAVCDKFGAITDAKLLAKFIIHTLNAEFIGIKHFASLDMCSRYEVAQLIVKKLKTDCIVHPVSSASFPLSAPRSISESIYSIIPSKILEDIPYSWKDLIINYMEEEFNV